MQLRATMSILTVLLGTTSGLFAGDDPLSMFTSHYGDDVKRVRATKDTADDAELAKKIIEETGTITADPKVQSLFYNKAFDLGIAGPEGFTACESALVKLSDIAPDQKASIDERLLQVIERRLRQAGISVNDREEQLGKYLAKLDEMVVGRLADKKFEEAAGIYSKAVPIFSSSNSPLPDRIARVKAKQVANNKVNTAKAKLKAKPDDASANRDLAMLYLVEFDEPAEAAKYAEDCGDPVVKEIAGLAAGDIAALDATKLIKLGDWYRAAGEKASEAGRPSAYSRAQACFARVAEVAGATEPQKDKAAHQVEQLAKLNAPVDFRSVANDTSEPLYLRTIAWDGSEVRRASAKSSAETLRLELSWPDARWGRAAVGYEFTHTRRIQFTFDEMKFELDEESAVGLVIDYHTKSGYTSRAVLLIGGRKDRFCAPALHTIGLHREEITYVDSRRMGGAPPPKARPGQPSNIVTTREPGTADNGSYESSDDISSSVRRGVEVRNVMPSDTYVKLAEQASFQLDLKNYAPKDWDNQVWIQLAAVNPKNSGAKIRARFEVTGYRPKK